MNTFIWNFKFVVLAVASSMLVLAGNVQGTENEKITVTISPAVQVKIQNQSPRERKRVETAIKAGNQFIPRYFDGSANNITDELSVKTWRKNIRPLVNKDFDKWDDMRLEKQSGVEIEITKRELADDLTVCPQVELVSLKIETGMVNLRYRARVIGALKFKRGMSHVTNKFIPDKENDFQEAVVGVDRNNKVDYVEEKYLGLFVTTDFYIDGYNMNIETRRHRLIGTPHDEQVRAKEEIQEYEEWIKLLIEQEAAVCKAN